MTSAWTGKNSLGRYLRATTALAGFAGALILLPLEAQAGPDACITVGSVSTCTDDQSDGIVYNVDFPSSSTVLNVNNLDSNIAPANDVNGIIFVGDTTVEINSELGNRDIILNGFAEGVIGAAPGDVEINHEGDIRGGFRGVNGNSDNGNVVINVEGDIKGSDEAAINAYAPNGTITIDYDGDIKNAENRGISAYGDGDIEIRQDGDIESVNQAIYAISGDGNANSGNGAISINSEGDIETSSGDGVAAESYAAGKSVTIIREGDTIAEDRAIWAYGDGNVSINSDGKVVSRDINAIHAYSTGGSASIVSDGDVKAANQAIFAHANSDASITSKGDVVAEGNDAIFALSSNGGTAKVNSEGDVKAGNRGILAFSNDYTNGGDVSIVSKGEVTANGDAIYAFTPEGEAYVKQRGRVTAVVDSGIRANVGNYVYPGNGNATIDSKGDVTARVFGLDAMVYGNGDIKITHEGDVTSFENHGVKAFINGNGNTTIKTTGDIQAQNMGIQAQTNGTGNTSITHRGDVTSTDDIGVYALTGGDIAIDVEGVVKARNIGIYARSDDSSTSVSVKSRGDVTSETANAIMAEAQGDGSTVSVDSVGDLFAGDINGIDYPGPNRGISAIADGDVDVTSKGDITANGTISGCCGDQPAGEGIYAYSQDGASSIISEGNIDVGNQGIFAIGELGASIDSKGNVTTDGNDAIFALKFFGGTGDATIKSIGDVNAGNRGIVAFVDSGGGAGSASINSQGDVSAKGDAIFALAQNANASVTQTGDVFSSDISGIRANVNGNGNATINSEGSVTASVFGLDAMVYGNGDINITHEGDVTSKTNIAVKSYISGNGNTTINVNGDLNADDTAVEAVTQGTGNTSIFQRGDVTSKMDMGISAYTGGNISIDVEGEIKARTQGIIAVSDASNSLVTVKSRGDVTSETHDAITAVAVLAGSTVNVDSEGDIRAGNFDYGIKAIASVDVSVRSIGDVRATNGAWSGIGIYAEGKGGSSSIFSRGDIDAGNQGIFANGATGASIDSEGNVIAKGNDGVFAHSTGGNASVRSVGDVTAGVRGVLAISKGGSARIDSVGDVEARVIGLAAIGDDGDATLNQTGDVTVLDGAGITANSKNGNATVNLTGNLSSKLNGVVATVDSGSGSAAAEVTGDVTVTQEQGIVAFAKGSGGAQVVSNGDVSARRDAVAAVTKGTGNASIDLAGDVTSTDSSGLIAYSYEGEASINSSGDVKAGFFGLFAGGDGNVTISHTGDVTSLYRDAVFAESKAGSVTINTNGNVFGQMGGGLDRNGIFALAEGNVSVTHVGNATTLSNMRAIHAQSNNGNVLVDVTGNISVNADYDDSDAIFVLATNGMADVIVREGSVVTGGQKALASFGVEFGTGTGPNSLQNYGLIDDANGGKTIGGGDADEIVANYGVVDGDFYLGGGANRFDNNEGGQTWLKAFSSVGSGNDFNNWGELSPFGVGEVGSSILEGNYNQSGTGVFIADIDLDGNTSDYLDVTGDVNAGGKVRANLTSLSTNLAPYSATIIYSNGTVFDNGISGITTGPLAVDVTTTSNTVDINVAIDFAANGKLDGNEEALGKGFQKYYENSAPGGLTPEQEEFYLALLNSGSLGEYKDALAGLSPEAAGAGILATMYGAENFAGRLFSCHQRDGVYRYIAEGSCAWAAASGSVWNHDGDDGFADYTDRSTWLSAGAQSKTDSGWVFGFGVGYEWGETEVDPSADLDREMFSGGVVAKYQQENWLFGAALSGGTGTIDSTRNVTIPSNETATGDRSVSYGDLTARIAYLMDYNSFYVKPMLEGAMTFVSAGGYKESGAGVANVTVEGDNYFTGRGTASVELGTEIAGADGMLVRPTVVAGVTVLTDGDIDVEAGFGNLGPQNITVVSERDQVALDLGAGIEVLGGSGWTGQIAYDGRFSGSDEQHALTLKLSMPF